MAVCRLLSPGLEDDNGFYRLNDFLSVTQLIGEGGGRALSQTESQSQQQSLSWMPFQGQGALTTDFHQRTTATPVT